MVDASSRSASKTKPPYTSFQSIKTLIQGFKEHDVPGRIDRSVLGNFSGAVGSQIMTALKFMDLIDGSNHPTEALRNLVRSYGGDEWSPALANIVRESYKPLFELNLETASPAQFNECFRSIYSGTDEVQRKSITFFLNAAREAGIKVSAYIMKNKKPRANGGARKPRAAKPASEKAEVSDVDPLRGQKGRDSGSTDTRIDNFKKELLDKFPTFDPSWPDNIKTEWFKSFEQFMGMAKK